MKKKSELIRSFIAIDLNEEIHQKISEIMASLSHKLKKESPKIENAIRWVPQKNIHITLHFLGDVQIETLQEISKQIQQLTSNYSTFSINIGGVGVFPKPERPRIIWVGVHSSHELVELHCNISQIIINNGCEIDEKPFQGHITIGRVKDFSDQAFAKIISSSIAAINKELRYNINKMEVLKIHIYKSTLHPSGAVYEKLFSHNLSTKL